MLKDLKLMNSVTVIEVKATIVGTVGDGGIASIIIEC